MPAGASDGDLFGGGSGGGSLFSGGGKLPPWLAVPVIGGAAFSGGQPTPANTSAWTTGNQNNQTTTGQSQYQNSDVQSFLNTLLNSQGRTSQTTSSNASTNPLLAPNQQALLEQLTRQYANLARNPTNLAPYTAAGTQQINRLAQHSQENLDSQLAARGLSTSPIAGTASANIDANRISQIAQLLQSIPLLRSQLNLGNLGAASSFLASVPRGSSQIGGTTVTGESDQTQTGYQGGRQVGSTEGQLSSTTNSATQTGQNSQSQSKTGGGIGGAISGGVAALLQILPFLL